MISGRKQLIFWNLVKRCEQLFAQHGVSRFLCLAEIFYIGVVCSEKRSDWFN